MTNTPLLADVAPITVRPNFYSTLGAVALLTTAEFVRRFAGADFSAAIEKIKKETGASFVAVWTEYDSESGRRVSAPLNGSSIVCGRQRIAGHQWRGATVRAKNGQAVSVIHSQGVA